MAQQIERSRFDRREAHPLDQALPQARADDLEQAIAIGRGALEPRVPSGQAGQGVKGLIKGCVRRLARRPVRHRRQIDHDGTADVVSHDGRCGGRRTSLGQRRIAHRAIDVDHGHRRRQVNPQHTAGERDNAVMRLVHQLVPASGVECGGIGPNRPAARFQPRVQGSVRLTGEQIGRLRLAQPLADRTLHQTAFGNRHACDARGHCRTLVRTRARQATEHDLLATLAAHDARPRVNEAASDDRTIGKPVTRSRQACRDDPPVVDQRRAALADIVGKEPLSQA